MDQECAFTTLQPLTVAMSNLNEENGVKRAVVAIPSSEITLELTEHPFTDGLTNTKNFASTKSAKMFAYKNLYGLSIGFVVANSSFIGLQNLQSSINSSDGLGVISLTILYAFFILSGFFTPGFIKLFGTKISLVIGFSCFLIYTLCNYYPSWYTLIPASILIGAATAPNFAAASAHLAEVAKLIAPTLGKDRAYLISKYTGIFFFFFQFAQIPGNLASSLILFPYGKSEQNFTDSSGDRSFLDLYLEGECGGLDSNSSTFRDVHQYSLISVYLLFNIAGLLILILCVDRLPTESNFFSSERKFYLYFQQPFIRLLRVLKHKHMLLIAPMAVTSGMEMAFVFGTFTELFISECFGVYLVGFTLILFGMSSSAMSMAYSKLVKCIPRCAIALFGASLNIGLIIFLLIWERVPSYAFIFSFAVIWGVANSVWNTVPTSWTGILFSDRTEVAYSAMRIWQAFGFCAGFATAELLPLEGRLGILCGVITLAAICSLIIQFITQPKEQLPPCIYRKNTSHDESGDDRDNHQPELQESYAYDRRDSLYDAAPLSPAGMNTMFAAYQGRRPSAWSMYSYNESDFNFSTQPNSHRPSAVVFTSEGTNTALSPVQEREEDNDSFLDAQSFGDEDLSTVGAKLYRSTSYMNAISAGAEGTLL